MTTVTMTRIDGTPAHLHAHFPVAPASANTPPLGTPWALAARVPGVGVAPKRAFAWPQATIPQAPAFVADATLRRVVWIVAIAACVAAMTTMGAYLTERHWPRAEALDAFPHYAAPTFVAPPETRPSRARVPRFLRRGPPAPATAQSPKPRPPSSQSSQSSKPAQQAPPQPWVIPSVLPPVFKIPLPR
jgi:hypothetical protein